MTPFPDARWLTLPELIERARLILTLNRKLQVQGRELRSLQQRIDGLMARVTTLGG